MPDPGTLGVAPATHLIRARTDDAVLALPLGSLVIAGTEPVLVDVGSPAGRDAWWRSVEALVDPGVVRWVFLSHDHLDHCGNLVEVLERCPQATLVASWRRGASLTQRCGVPASRTRLVADGETFTAGDRDLTALRPPAYDSPATSGLFDHATSVYWASVCFGTPVPHDVDDVADLDRDVWENGFSRYHRLLSPWISDVDPIRWRAAVGRVAVRAPRVIASARGPLIRRGDVGRALDLLADLAGLPEVPSPVPVRAGISAATPDGLARR